MKFLLLIVMLATAALGQNVERYHGVPQGTSLYQECLRVQVYSDGVTVDGNCLSKDGRKWVECAPEPPKSYIAHNEGGIPAPVEHEWLSEVDEPTVKQAEGFMQVTLRNGRVIHFDICLKHGEIRVLSDTKPAETPAPNPAPH